MLTELSKQYESCDTQGRDIQKLQLENKTLMNELNDVKVQLEVKVHSLKEKLVDNENLTDKLKKTYECQIENLNVMINKLTSYLKDKTVELDTVRKEKDRLQQIVDENNKGKHRVNVDTSGNLSHLSLRLDLYRIIKEDVNINANTL